jgi:hypothetical protein
VQVLRAQTGTRIFAVHGLFMRWLPSPSVMDLPGEAALAHALALRGKAPSRAKSNAQKKRTHKAKSS